MKSKAGITRRAFALLSLSLSTKVKGASDAYRLALPGYHFEFPRDHFNHPEFQTEWWYYTGNLRSAEGRRFGFELTFFRQGVSRKETASVWDVRDVWMAHLALSDIDGKQFLHTERFNRAGAGIAGADLPLARVWNGNWQAQWATDSTKTGRQTLQAVAERFSFELTLHSDKAPVIHGVNGVSQKAEGAGKASHYISFTRLITRGTLTLDGRRFSLDGTSWMDHEFFSHQMEAQQSGWDWFSLQMEDDTELMLFRLRRTDGTPDLFSAGTFVDTNGESRHLSASDFIVTPGKTWTSDATGGRYPVEWTIEIPSLRFKASIRTPLVQQELTGSSRSSTAYWEGVIDIDANVSGKPVRGVGYLEMTGYAGRIVGLD